MKMNFSFLKLHIDIFDKKKQLHWILFVDFDSQMKINFEHKIDFKENIEFREINSGFVYSGLGIWSNEQFKA